MLIFAKHSIEPSLRGAGARPRRGPRSRAATLAWLLLLAALTTCASGNAATQGTAPYQAAAGLDAAREAADSWSRGAVLIYVENDEELDAEGSSARWTYLFYSSALDQFRFFSVRAGRILVADNLELELQAPPVAAHWIDSGAALAAAERGAGGEFRRQAGGRLTTMLLMRGAFEDKAPDRTTWTLVYSAPNAASLYVEVDAAAGKVRRSWRG